MKIQNIFTRITKVTAILFSTSLLLFSPLFAPHIFAIGPTCSTTSPCWFPKAPMLTARRDLGIAADANGKIFAAGGFNGSETNTLEMYDPATDTWTTKTSAPIARGDIGFAFDSANGKFYFGGGWNEGAHNEFYEYDPSTDSWTQKASIPTASYGLRFTTANGKIYAIGGVFTDGTLITNVEEYNPSTNQWATKSAIPTPRLDLGLVTASNGKIYAIGGQAASVQTTYVDEYDPTTDTWTAKANMPTARSDFGYSLNSGGNIDIVGGFSNTVPNGMTNVVEEYNPSTDTWVTSTPFTYGEAAIGMALSSDGNVYMLGGETTIVGDQQSNHVLTATAPVVNCSGQNPCWKLASSMPTPRRDFGVAADANGRIYAAGGYDNFITSSTGLTTSLEMYDPATDTWTTKSPVPVTRNDMGFTFNPANNKFYFGGGWNGSVTNDFYEYNPATDTWTAKASLPTASLGLRFAAAPNGKIYAIGGGFTLITNVEEYDPATNTWTMKSALPHPGQEKGVVTGANGKIYVIGGQAASIQTAYVDEYDPTTDTWTAKANMPTARSDMGVSLNANGVIDVAGGETNNGFTSAVEEYDPTTNTWTTKTSLPFPTYAIGMALGNDGNLYSIGGETVNDYVTNANYSGIAAISVGHITVSPNPVQVNSSAAASATFIVPNTSNTLYATWNWGDGTTTSGTVTEPNGTNPGNVANSHTYTNAGVYTITLIITDGDGGTATQTFQYLSVYNPTSQGLFSAGSKYISPAGAYIQNPNLTGDVKFGLSYKYQGTMPVGDKQFAMNFSAANLTFKATTISSLVIANNQATLTGTGTINGSGNYNFLIIGVDGGGIRIQITDPAHNNAVIYDTQPGAAATATPTTSVTGHVIVH